MTLNDVKTTLLTPPPPPPSITPLSPTHSSKPYMVLYGLTILILLTSTEQLIIY